MDHEGVGGFLESILAVMVVITASSVLMVVLASGALQVEENIDQEDLVSWLKSNRLYSENEAIAVRGPNQSPGMTSLPEGISGLNLVYRLFGDPTPLLVIDLGDSPQGDVLSFQLPLLIEVDGWERPGVMEVRAWR
ncbi:MAG: hypothetical protein KBA58_04990 [Methanomassiliicoccales archaeon]|nr:hypothetical protein [Methanomassiliicoccales archaeon]